MDPPGFRPVRRAIARGYHSVKVTRPTRITDLPCFVSVWSPVERRYFEHWYPEGNDGRWAREEESPVLDE